MNTVVWCSNPIL